VQVIIKTSFPGQAPRVVEEQVTYPITTTMLSVPGAKAVRGYSFFGDSYVYVIFEDGTDLYWARARVLEYLNQAAADLPDGVQPRLGPDATGVGWVYSYALVDRTGRHDLAQLTSLQNWFLKFELQTCPACPRSPPSAAWCASTRSSSTRRSCAPTASRWRGSSAAVRAPTARSAARCWSWPRPSTWSAPAAISPRSRTSS
jgi:hypothetical protein